MVCGTKVLKVWVLIAFLNPYTLDTGPKARKTAKDHYFTYFKRSGYRKGPRTQIIGFHGPSTWALKPYYLGPWTLRVRVTKRELSSVFFEWLNLVRIYSLYRVLYPKRRIESYSIVGTIVSPNKILLNWDFTSQRQTRGRSREHLRGFCLAKT